MSLDVMGHTMWLEMKTARVVLGGLVGRDLKFAFLMVEL